jgi:hypothetical protein
VAASGRVPGEAIGMRTELSKQTPRVPVKRSQSGKKRLLERVDPFLNRR